MENVTGVSQLEETFSLKLVVVVPVTTFLATHRLGPCEHLPPTGLTLAKEKRPLAASFLGCGTLCPLGGL